MCKDFEVNVSRRRFIAGAGAVAAGALATAGVTLASAEEINTPTCVSDESITWSEEHEIVVAGSGTALFGAYYAHIVNGSDVILLEKGGVLGGSSKLSGFGIFLPMNPVMDPADDRDEAFDYIKSLAEGASSDELINAYIDASEKYSPWLVAEDGCAIDLVPGYEEGIGVYDCYQDKETWRVGRSLVPSLDFNTKVLGEELVEIYGIDGGGPAAFAKLVELVDASGMPYKLECGVISLVKDATGAIVGVGTSTGEWIKATKGVLLGMGGFDHNAAMRRDYLRAPLFGSVAVHTNTGDAVAMGLDAGADLAQMQSVWGYPVFLGVDQEVDPDNLQYLTASYAPRGLPGTIMVNKHGVRFANELANYHVFNRQFESYVAQGQSFEQNWPGYLIADAKFVENYGDLTPQYGESKSYDSLEELANDLGIDYANLTWQVEQFNAFCETGVDTQFGRGEGRWDREFIASMGGDYAAQFPNGALGPISTPPFQVALCYPGCLTTRGGLKTNGKAQVLSRTGQVIPGLYASGGSANTPLGEGYPSMGGPIGTGVLMSLVAVDAMVQQ